jgi:inner membrane protease subunit 1
MFPAVARRIIRRGNPIPIFVRNAQSISPSIRYASTKPPIKSRVKSQITNAIVNPAPPVLARYPKIYWTVRYIIFAIGGALAWHIFCEYFFTLSQAEGISMLPTINATGDWLLLSKRYRKGRGVVVGDIVSFKHPIDEHTRSVKRVIGMPGDIVLRDSPDKSGQMIQVCLVRDTGIIDKG